MIYLDNAATTVPRKEVVNLIIDMLQNEIWANPNSAYEIGLQSRRIIEESRHTIAKKINCDPEEIIFVPSASAANAQAIIGYMNKNDCHNWITSNLEHSSISEIEIKFPYKYKHIVKCDNDGLLFPEQFENYRNCLVSIVGANSEIGTIQPIKEIAKVLHKNNNVFHSDLTAYWPYINVDVKDLDLDMATLSSHKIHGLKNCGILYIKKGIELSPLVFGHSTLWGGTEDIYNIAAMGKAAELLKYDNIKNIRDKRDYLLDKLLDIDGITLNGNREKRLPNNINICINNISIDNQQLVSVLDISGYQISSGTACNSGNKEPSSTLLALGLTPEQANHSVRITLCEDNTYDELDEFYNDFKNIIEQFKIK